MDLVEIVKLSSFVAGGISIAIAGHGIICGKYNLEDARDFYRRLTDEQKENVMKPSPIKIYFESLKEAPRTITSSLKKRKGENAYNRYMYDVNKQLSDYQTRDDLQEK